MKHLKTIFACLLMAVLNIGQVWADATFISANEAATSAKNGISLSVTSGSLASGDYYRIDKGATLTISSTSGNIESIVFTCTSSTYAKLASHSPEGTYSENNATVSWSGSASEVTFTAKTGSSNKNFRFSQVVITTAAAGEDPTLSVDPTVIDFGTVEQNAVVASQTVEVSFANLTGSVAYSGLSSPFTASGTISSTGDEITIAANTANVGNYSQTLTVQSTADSKSAEVTVKMNVVEPFDGLELTFDFVTHPEGWPAAKASAAAGNYIYTISATDYTFAHSKVGDGIYCTGTSGTSGALLMASGNTLGLPAISGYKLVKVEGTLNSAGTPSTSSQVAITDGTDAVTGGAAQTWDTKGAAKTYNLSGTQVNTMYYLSVSNKNCQMMTLVLYYEEAEAPTVAAPTISGETSFLSSTSVTITQNDADHIYYTIDGSDPKTSGTKLTYSAPFTVNADGTTTVKAYAVKSSDESDVAEKTFTKITPLTVAQALAATPAANQYVAGVVASVTEVSTEHGNATYTIKDAGVENSIIIYRGKYLNNVAFTAVDQIEEGDEVTVFGEIKVHSEVNQFTTGNYIVAMFPKARLAWSGTTAGVFEASLEGGNTFPTLINSNSVTVEYSSSNTGAATINASTGEISLVGVGSTTITANFTGNPSFKANSVSYTLNVSSSVIKADISFECNGATSCPETMLAQSNLPSPLPTVIKAGKNFGGWFTDSEFNTPAVAGAAVESTDAITLYAKWLDPYSVTEALSIINALADGAQTESILYVAGIVSTAPSAAPSSGKLTFFISVNGEAENELQAYNCKDLGNEGFDSQDDIQVGDEVTIFGPLKKFIKNEEVIPEFNTGYLYSFNRPAKPTITANPAEVTNVVAEGVTNQTIALTYDNIENYLVEVTLHDDAEGTEAFSDTWLTASVSGADNYATITYSVAANEGAARTAYMKVNAIGDDDKEATKIIAVSQEAYVAPAAPAELPFAFDGGRADIASTQGMSQDGLDSDYGSSPKLKFNTTGDYVIINIASDPGKLTYDIIGNGFSGGTFKVQESVNGVDYTDVATYTELGAKASEEQTLLQATRFVKFIYTEKVSGNVALGNIAIAAYVAPAAVETPAFSPAGGEYAGAQSVTISCETGGATIYYTTDGTDPDNTSDEYTDAINVDESKTIKAIAYKGDDHSEIASATYTITAPLTDYYEKVTSGDVAEGTYLIVYEAGSLAFDGGADPLDAVENSIAVDIVSGNKIGVTSATEAATFYIDPTAGTIQAASGKYIGQTSDANGLGTSESASTYTNSFSFDEGNAVIVSSSAHLCYNSTSNQLRFRYYKSSSYSSQQPIALYKLANEVIKPASGLAWDPADDIELTVGDAFTAPTLLNPNSIDAADITIESSNTDLATVTNGVVELVADATGSATITATYTGETYKPTTVSYKIKVNPAASIYVSPSLNVNFGSVEVGEAVPGNETVTVTLTNVANATAALGGANPGAFSIDKEALTASGDITISILANTDAAATYSATLTISDDATENPADSKVINLSFEVTEPVVEETPVSTTSKWVLATAIEDGMQVLITGVKADVTYAMGAASSNGNNRTSVAGSLDEGVFTPGENTMPFTLVATGVANTYYIKTSNNQYIYNASTSSKSYLRTKAEQEEVSWTITLDGDNNAVITSVENTNRQIIRFNPNGGNDPLFNCYASGQNDIKLYVPQTTPPTPATPDYTRDVTNGHYGTICLPKAGTIEGATLYAIGAFENSLIYIDEVGTTLAAGVPYIFYASEAQLNVYYTDKTADDVPAGNANGLFGFYNLNDEGATFDISEDAGNYILYNDQYWLVSGRAAYIANYRAYIKIGSIVPKAPAPGRRRVAMAVNGTQTATGIEDLNASEKPMKMMINGQIFILRGEKMYDTTGRLVK